VTASQNHIGPHTPMGAKLIDGGATFRVWAPHAEAVHIALGESDTYQPDDGDLLIKNPHTGHWTGFVPGVMDGGRYRFWIKGPNDSGLKRDPRAREVEPGPPPRACVVRDDSSYPWHDQWYRPPPFNDLIVYQLHIGRFYARDAHGADRRVGRVAKLLDVLDRVRYLRDLGVNAIQPLPLIAFEMPFSLGYNPTDLYAMEEDYAVPAEELDAYVDKVNDLLRACGVETLTREQLGSHVNQLKAFVDVCHLHGLAVIPDVVYNHAGGNFDRESIDYFDFPANPGNTNNLYFQAAGEAGGRVFAFERPDVAAFLIDNAKMFLTDYHCDGMRFDHVQVIERNGGWDFCRHMTDTLRFVKPEAVLIVEYWGDDRAKATRRPPNDGMGFDIGYEDAVRDGVRRVVGEASGGPWSHVSMGRLADELQHRRGERYGWQAYNSIENHDLLWIGAQHPQPRIAQLADPSNSRSWHACSRTRVATGLLVTTRGTPMLFMGQEFLQDRLWSDDPRNATELIWWDGQERDPHMRAFHRFTQDLLWLRRRHPALRAEPLAVYYADDYNRVLAFHRWVPWAGRDVVVVACLREWAFRDASFPLGFPQPGVWHEVFNSDAYDSYGTDDIVGNAGIIDVTGGPRHGLAHSANISIPANGLVAFARDRGDF
jgi:1,4-alpha-glucan branching enzyme